MNQHYELAYIVPITYLEGDLQKVNDEVSVLIKQLGGEITLTEDMGKRRLAYPINQIFQGSYFAVEFDMESVNTKELETKLKLKKEILRHSIVKKRIKSAEEIARETKIQEGSRNAKQDEINKIEADEKATVKKVVEDEVKISSASANKEASKAKLEDLDKKLDEILKDDVI
ncbi:MAG: 30S ribosomal protein S6 [Patescibacteria group bacterium]